MLSLERLLRENKLRGSEIFVFTDNGTAESAFWKGTSSSELLFELVLRLRELELEYDLILHVVHVAGKRMIDQGADSLSRADNSVGVMKGIDIRFFVPLHLNALERCPEMKRWLLEVCADLKPTFLEPEDWFEQAHTYGNFIWTPPPAAVEVVVDQLGKWRLKRPECVHLVVVPRLMTGRWRRALKRGTDFYFKIDWDDVWPLKKFYEPLLIFVVLPRRVSEPNLDARSRLLDSFERRLLQQELSEVPAGRRRIILRKLFVRARRLSTLP